MALQRRWTYRGAGHAIVVETQGRAEISLGSEAKGTVQKQDFERNREHAGKQRL